MAKDLEEHLWTGERGLRFRTLVENSLELELGNRSLGGDVEAGAPLGHFSYLFSCAVLSGLQKVVCSWEPVWVSLLVKRLSLVKSEVTIG